MRMRTTIDKSAMERVTRAIEVLGRPGSSQEWRLLFRDCAVYAARVVQLRFAFGQGAKQDAEGRWRINGRFATTGNPNWPAPYWLYTTIRKNVGKRRGAITTIESAKAITANPLNDSGALRQSWQASANLRAGNDYSEVGTHLAYAEDHDEGRMVPFTFGADKQQRFDYNVSKGEPGNWNADYFKMRAMLKKREATGVQLRQREIVPRDFPNASDTERLNKVAVAWIYRVLGEAASGGAP